MKIETASARLTSLRQTLRIEGLQGFLIPMADEYQSEYVPPSAKRIEFLSGFTGSAGFIVVLDNDAAFFTDSRYTLQASQQVPTSLYGLYDSAVKTPAAWVGEKAEKGIKIGFDPWLHTAVAIERWHRAMEEANITLIPVKTNPIDALWTDRPAPPMADILPYEAKYAGKSSAEKRQALADSLQKDKIDAAIITDPASIAWLLNVRGGDVPNTPLPLSFAILRNDATVQWFVSVRKAPNSLLSYLGAQIQRGEPGDFLPALRRLGEMKKRVRIDPNGSSFEIIDQLEKSGAILDRGDDPCLLPKACKNNVELDGMRTAHRRDGAALTSLLAWLDTQENVTELDVEKELEQRRSLNALYRGPSFDTIAGSGPNGAIVHYRATNLTNRKIGKGEFLLLDSGGQYLDGTTDVTRTIAIGAISVEMKDRFTRVLKGHIALASIKFPLGTTGADLDVLARQYLWEIGLDYGHGTGHGVGSYLGVHEGPQSISHRSHAALKPGMVVSNEPGYYEPNRFGIRIENLVTVVEAKDISTPTNQMLGFETITLVPIDTRAILLDKLTVPERAWLNHYHTRVRESLRPLINDPVVLDWLQAATKEV